MRELLHAALLATCAESICVLHPVLLDTQSHPGLGEVRAHSGMLSAAKGVLADLERHQIIRSLLTWNCRPADGGEDSSACGGGGGNGNGGGGAVRNAKAQCEPGDQVHRSPEVHGSG